MLSLFQSKLMPSSIKQFKAQAKLSGRQVSRIASLVKLINEGFWITYRDGAFDQPNQLEHTRLVRYFCRQLCKVFDLEVTVHAPVPTQHALWVSNHVSWLDIAVIGSQARIFFLAKAEIQQWPILGRLVQAGGTLFIQRGSGDSVVVKQQITGFLNQQIPILFFPEATTTDGQVVKRLHGKLLSSAIDTQTPIQPVVLCYVNDKGQLDEVVPFIQDQRFIDNFTNVLKLDRIQAHLLPLAPISPQGHDVDSLTQLLHQRMSEGLATLQQRVLQGLPHGVNQDLHQTI